MKRPKKSGRTLNIQRQSAAPRQDFLRMNERIRVREVRLVDEEGNQVGIVETRHALDLAREKGLDLIEVAPNANPPVCRIMDYGRFKYEQSKREKETRKKSKATEIKGVRIKTPRIGDHDYEVRVRDAIRFLSEGDKVKVSILLKSREITHPELARDVLVKMMKDIEEYAIIEKPPALEARTYSMTLAPKPNLGAEKSDKSDKKEAAEKKAPPAERPNGESAAAQPTAP